MICDATTIWVVMKTEKEVNISQFDPKESLSIDRLYKIYETETKAKYEKDDKLGTLTYSKVSLFALNKTTDYSKVELWINKKSGIIEMAEIHQRNGAIVKYELTNIKTDSGVTESEFVFNKSNYPGFEIVDLR